MGRNNRQRRAAKQRRQRAQQARRARRHSATGPGAPPDVDAIMVAALHAWDTDPAKHAALLDRLVTLAGDGAPVLTAASARMDDVLDQLWRHGWTPADVVHVTSRRLDETHGRAVRHAVLVDGQRRAKAGSPPHPRWQAQLDALADGQARASLSDVRPFIGALALLVRLPVIPSVMPPPELRTAADDDVLAGMDQRMLARVRALLAKAESTEFDEEAEALTAKAQELITRHAIADALLESPDDVGAPAVRRVPVDNPYPDAKASLLTVVAEANRCDAVYTADLGWMMLFGYDRDLDAVELLGASLLAQATSAMARHGARRGRDGRSTTRSFRRAFLFGFAGRIGERLRAAADGEVAATEAARTRLLPILAARDGRVQAAVDEAFPNRERRSTQISNPTGWTAGQAAADVADLGTRDRSVTGGRA